MYIMTTTPPVVYNTIYCALYSTFTITLYHNTQPIVYITTLHPTLTADSTHAYLPCLVLTAIPLALTCTLVAKVEDPLYPPRRWYPPPSSMDWGVGVPSSRGWGVGGTIFQGLGSGGYIFQGLGSGGYHLPGVGEPPRSPTPERWSAICILCCMRKRLMEPPLL